MYKNEYQKQTEVSTKSFWGIWSLITIGKYPKDFCTLFWNTFLSIVTLPLWIIPGIFVNLFLFLKDKHHGVLYFYWLLINFLALGLGSVVHSKTEFSESALVILGTIFISGWIIITKLCIFIALLVLIFWCVDKIKGMFYSNKNTYFQPSKISVIKQFFHDFKAKHCSFINWK